MRQYRILELTNQINTFTPQYSDDSGSSWYAIGKSTCLTKEAAEGVIDIFINSGGRINEIIHQYNADNKKILHD